LNRWIVFGGTDIFPEVGGTGSYYDSTFIYDFNTASWAEQQITSQKPQARAFSSLINLPDGNLLLFGGKNKESVFGDSWVYDVQNSGWIYLNTSYSPSPRYSHCAAFDGNSTIYVFGGSDIYGNVLNDVWTFSNNQWTNVTSSLSPPPRRGHTCAYGAGQFFIFGGDNLQELFNDVWSFNLAQKSWKKFPSNSPPSKRTWLGYSSFHQNALFVFGGCTTVHLTDNVLQDFWKYTL